MQLITRRTIERFVAEHAGSEQPFSDWCAMVEGAHWRDADHLVQTSEFRARAIGNKRVVFNIKGNTYRIICSVQYADLSKGLNGRMRVHFVGTHAEYDKIDAETVNLVFT